MSLQQVQMIQRHLNRHHHEHWETLASVAGVPPGWFTESVMSTLLRQAKDLYAQAEDPVELCPIYEFEVTDNSTGARKILQGWWTIHPTDDISTVALYRSLERNVSEQARNARTRRGRTFIAGIAAGAAGMLRAQLSLLLVGGYPPEYVTPNAVLSAIAARVGATY